MKPTTRLFAGALILGFALIACGPGTRDGHGEDDRGDPNAGPDSGSRLPSACNKMDLVFVIDNSGSMSEEQANLAANFPLFANLLTSYVSSDGQRLDFRVALTTTGKTITYAVNFGGQTFPATTEVGDNGAFRNNCNVAKRWLEPVDANLGQTLACRANVGTSGPAFEMPMLMTKYALSDRVLDGTNGGFLRDDALLGVVMITDEDDGSNTLDTFEVSGMSAVPPVNFHPADAVQFLDTLKGHRSRWAVGVIAGASDCTSSFGKAMNATRLKELVNFAGPQGTFSSICDGDLTVGLRKILEGFQSACGGIIL